MSRRSCSSSGQRCYVDNAYNRQLGRVGKPLGTHVVHNDGSVTQSNFSTRGSSSSSSSQRRYVDNSYNRDLGRVGKPLGTHVVHKDGSVTRSSSGVSSASSSSQGPGYYVDNAYNRKLGRVGKPLGTHVVHSNGSVTVSGGTEPGECCRPWITLQSSENVAWPGGHCCISVVPRPNMCVRNVRSRCSVRVEPVPQRRALQVAIAAKPGNRCCVDNARNRCPARVEPVPQRKARQVARPGDCCYVDNAHNRCLGRVGKPLSQRRVHQIVEKNTVEDLIHALQGMGFVDARRADYQYALDRLERKQLEERWKKDNIQPSTDVSCCSHHSPEFIPHSELRLEDRMIGRGGFGEVYAALWHGTPVAFKKLLYQQMSKKHKESFKNEIKVLATINHPNTVKMLGAVIEEGKIGIVMEYLQRSLFQAVFIDETCFSVSKKKQIVSQMASALLYLHTHEPKIAHCDVKSENVLLDAKDNAKLGDFGLSALKNTTESSRSTVAGVVPGQGTPHYSAPEVLRGEILNKIDQLFQADVYSLGIVVFEVVTEEEPFEGLNVKQLEANVGHGDLRPTTSITLAQPLTDLLERCWDGSAFKRVTVAEFQERWSSISGSLYKNS